MKEYLKKISDKLRIIFGYGIMISLFAGSLCFFAYVAAIIIGGETAALICGFVYKKFIPAMIYFTTSLVLFGIVLMYMAGEYSLVPESKEKKKK